MTPHRRGPPPGFGHPDSGSPASPRLAPKILPSHDDEIGPSTSPSMPRLPSLSSGEPPSTFDNSSPPSPRPAQMALFTNDGGSPRSPRPVKLGLSHHQNNDGSGGSRNLPQLPPIPFASPPGGFASHQYHHAGYHGGTYGFTTGSPSGSQGQHILPVDPFISDLAQMYQKLRASGLYPREPPPVIGNQQSQTSGDKDSLVLPHINRPHPVLGYQPHSQFLNVTRPGPPPGFRSPTSPRGFGTQQPRTSSISANVDPSASPHNDKPHPPPESIFGRRARSPEPSPSTRSALPRTPPESILGRRTSLSKPIVPSPSVVERPSQTIQRPSGPPRRPMPDKCFSLASTRVYDNTLRCDRCGRGSDLGWFYRCCHETDARLYDSIQRGNQECFDEIGEMFAKELRPPVRGAAARQDPLSPLNEMTPAQVGTYSSNQLSTVLRQHENAAKTAVVERHEGFSPPPELRPYLMSEREECKTTLCPRCGKGGLGQQQSFLSLDGVLKGDIPPTAAVGYGFREMGGRPVANANIVKNLGLRDPKTGLLPDQQKKKDEEAAAAAAAAGKSEGNTDKLGGDDTAKAGHDAGEEVAQPIPIDALAISAETSESNTDVADKAESDETDISDTDDTKPSAQDVGPGVTTTPGSIKAQDSNEDLIQYYADSEEDTLGNGGHEHETH